MGRDIGTGHGTWVRILLFTLLMPPLITFVHTWSPIATIVWGIATTPVDRVATIPWPGCSWCSWSRFRFRFWVWCTIPALDEEDANKENYLEGEHATCDRCAAGTEMVEDPILFILLQTRSLSGLRSCNNEQTLDSFKYKACRPGESCMRCKRHLHAYCEKIPLFLSPILATYNQWYNIICAILRINTRYWEYIIVRIFDFTHV